MRSHNAYNAPTYSRKDLVVSLRAKQKEARTLTGLPGESTIQRATPFLKWAGGKSQLITTYDGFFPKRFNRYFEPFTGGGAIFFHLKNQRGEFKASLSDLNDELINCYRVIKNDVEELISHLKTHPNDEDYFYELRAVDAKTLSEIERAARLIYLNKTCFNGLYRVNSKGQFNVPFGFYKNPRTCNETNLRACSAALADVELNCRPFDHVLKFAKKGDLVYFDPPYHPLSSTANFTSYTRNCFSADDQEHLADVFAKLDKRGCHVMLSNSDCAFIRDLYKDFSIETVNAIRAINCKSEGRGKITEVLVLNR